MIDQDLYDALKLKLTDRLTPDELIEILGVSVDEIFDRFEDECLEINWELVLE